MAGAAASERHLMKFAGRMPQVFSPLNNEN